MTRESARIYPRRLKQLMKEIDHDKGFQAQQDDATVPVANSDVLKLGPKPVKNGKW